MGKLLYIYNSNKGYSADYFRNKGLLPERAVFDSSAVYYELECLYFDAEPGPGQVLELRRMLETEEADVLYLDRLLSPDQKSMFVFDMDSTLIRQEVIDEIARSAGVYDEVATVTREAMEGKLDFNQSLQKRCSYLNGVDESVFGRVYDNLVLNDGVAELLGELNKRGVITCVLSGGFERILAPFAQKYGFNHHAANILEISDGRLTGKVLGRIVNKDVKKEKLVEIREKENVAKEQVVAVGDGANDLLMLREAGYGFGFHAKDGLKKDLLNWVDFSPMTALLFLFNK